MQLLRDLLRRIDGKGYKAYKRLAGDYRFPDYRLRLDHIQGDPFAEPSRARLFLDAARMALPPDLFGNPIRTVALEDFLGRRYAGAIGRFVKGQRGSGKSGEIRIARYGQQVLVRNAVLVREGAVELRFQLALPAEGRQVLAQQAEIMLFEEIPQLVEAALLTAKEPLEDVYAHVESVENQEHLRGQLTAQNLVAFIADGASLPRSSGIDDRPLTNAVPFCAPDSMAVTLQPLHGPPLRGMGIPRGVNLIVGGGFHGKSTLLQALERGVYNHIPGDGRERVVTEPSAVKVRAEDGRAITGVDISPFIDNLPQGKNTHRFSTENASGSTSQAANILEALAGGARTLLIDEDTSATNFMIRDLRMQQLVAKDKEPITPLVQRIGDLFRGDGVSVVLVMGGSSDFFAGADRVIMMDNYRPRDVTAKAHRLAQPPQTSTRFRPVYLPSVSRCPAVDCLDANLGRREKIQAQGIGTLRYGADLIDVSCVEQLVDEGQLLAIGFMLRDYGKKLASEGKKLAIENKTLAGESKKTACDEKLPGQNKSERQQSPGDDLVVCLRALLANVEQRGLDSLSPYIVGTLALPRLQELLATLNRKRNLQLIDQTGEV